MRLWLPCHDWAIIGGLIRFGFARSELKPENHVLTHSRHATKTCWPKRSRGSGVAWGHGCVRCGATRAVWLLASSVRHPSPRIRVCVAVRAEAVRSAACAAVSSLRKLSSGGYRCHDRASFRVRLGAYHSPLVESAYVA